MYIILTPKKEKILQIVLKKAFLSWGLILSVAKLENLRKIISVKIVNNEKDYLKHINKPTFISTKIFDKNYDAIHEIKPVLTLNKPIYVGFTVL